MGFTLLIFPLSFLFFAKPPLCCLQLLLAEVLFLPLSFFFLFFNVVQATSTWHTLFFAFLSLFSVEHIHYCLAPSPYVPLLPHLLTALPPVGVKIDFA